MIAITETIEIPEDEIEIVATRSGGPGGQNVNKVSSRVTLRFNLEGSSVLSPEQRARIRAKLSSRVSKTGVLQVSSQRTRSQEMNRVDARARFAELLRNALREDKPRRKTKVTAGAREERLREKRRRTDIKRSRSGKGPAAWDD